MEKINGMNISDMYGEDAKNVPDEIFEINSNFLCMS